MADHAATPDPPDDVPGSPESGTAELARLFREHNASLVLLLRARLRSDQEAWDVAQEAYVRMLQRSEERRGGKECVSTCRLLWSPYHENKKITQTRTKQK